MGPRANHVRTRATKDADSYGCRRLLLKPQTYKLAGSFGPSMRCGRTSSWPMACPIPLRRPNRWKMRFVCRCIQKLWRSWIRTGAACEGLLLLAAEGIVTGNIFDLEPRATREMFATQSPDFSRCGQRSSWIGFVVDRSLRGAGRSAAGWQNKTAPAGDVLPGQRRVGCDSRGDSVLPDAGLAGYARADCR